MAKISVFLCVVLVVSVAFAYDPEEERQKIQEQAVKNCVRSINRVFTEVAQKYEKTVKPMENEEMRNKAWDYYSKAADILNGLNAQVRNSKEPIRMSFVLKTFGGNAIMCSDDVSRKVYDAFYDAYDGLDKLAQQDGQ
ncbi:uncharacterized protein [Venturia canescens]|uniref:uncharacterized protein n=1 Tax=Venturia canescens TaxID=32260 RepID=UPI001C9C9869|nr:uncharacterized protein LOC122417687 [Venturia canescens]XP_043287374.1 uncharacterized protein LOC122417687 [Venturia canescens]XP_043287375.1 uncharacterized protein LOC122417687 [Venturia canescens]